MAAFQPDEFPILCETCLGDNPYLRMTRERFAKACKICERPFHVFRWRPGPRARFKKTEICGTCAKLKNVCQTCILDLQYGLPVQVRDEALHKDDLTAVLDKDVLPVSHPNRNYMYEQLEHQCGLGGANSSLQLPYAQLALGNAQGTNTEQGDAKSGGAMLQRMTRRDKPYYKRNLPHIRSFYVRGICNRGSACPYRHVNAKEEALDSALKDQNIKDRFYGVNDPVAKKMLRKYEEWTHGTEEGNGEGNGDSARKRRPLPAAPSDVAIRTLFVGGVDWSISEDLVRNKLGVHGEITSVALLQERKCGFVTFAERESAEKAMRALFDALYLNKRKCELNWAHSKGGNGKDSTKRSQVSHGDGNDNGEEVTEVVSAVAAPQTQTPIQRADVITAEETEFLKAQGIVPPDLPPLPDPCSTSVTSYGGTTDTMYKSQSAHYKEAKISQ